jgi:WD40 repeat protein
VLVWDLDAGADPVATFTKKAETDIPPGVALSPVGDYLAVAGVIHDGLRVIALREDGTPTVAQFLAVETAAFHPTQNELYSISGGHVVAAPPEARPRELTIHTVEDGGPLVFSRDGARLVVRRDQRIRVYETGGPGLAAITLPQTHLRRTIPVAGRAALSAPVPHSAFSPDGGQIAIGYDQALGVYHAVTGEERFLDNEVEAQVSGVAFDPGGRWLYVGRRDGTLVAYHTDTFAPDRRVVFRWSLGPIHALAPCGDSLLAACDEGAQLWPMAKLLEGV